jgi:hypothetical protein
MKKLSLIFAFVALMATVTFSVLPVGENPSATKLSSLIRKAIAADETGQYHWERDISCWDEYQCSGDYDECRRNGTANECSGVGDTTCTCCDNC